MCRITTLSSFQWWWRPDPYLACKHVGCTHIQTQPEAILLIDVWLYIQQIVIQKILSLDELHIPISYFFSSWVAVSYLLDYLCCIAIFTKNFFSRYRSVSACWCRASRLLKHTIKCSATDFLVTATAWKLQAGVRLKTLIFQLIFHASQCDGPWLLDTFNFFKRTWHHQEGMVHSIAGKYNEWNYLTTLSQVVQLQHSSMRFWLQILLAADSLVLTLHLTQRRCVGGSKCGPSWLWWWPSSEHNELQPQLFRTI